MKKVYIYGLCDPREPELIKYVGRTSSRTRRLIQHCSKGGTTPNCVWIRNLKSDGILPQMVILEIASESNARERENHWIQAHKRVLNNINYRTEKQEIESNPLSEETLSFVERKHIQSILLDSQYNMVLAAKRLGIGRQTLYNKCDQFGLRS